MSRWKQESEFLDILGDFNRNVNPASLAMS